METEFDLCDLSELENQGHDLKLKILPSGPMGKLYVRYHVEKSDQIDGQIDTHTWTAPYHNMPDGCIKQIITRKLTKSARASQGHRTKINLHQKHTRSRSYNQGQRSQEQNVMPICTYSSWVVHRHILAMLASIPWT